MSKTYRDRARHAARRMNYRKPTRMALDAIRRGHFAADLLGKLADDLRRFADEQAR